MTARPRPTDDAARKAAHAMAHDLRNALNAMAIHAETLARACRRHGDEPALRSATAIADGVERSAAILDAYMAKLEE